MTELNGTSAYDGFVDRNDSIPIPGTCGRIIYCALYKINIFHQ